MKKKTNSVRRLAMLLCFAATSATMLYAQSVKVRGTVTDANTGEPLIGVTVQEKDSKNNAVTDLDGNFVINADKGKALEFSYIGFLPKQVTVKGNRITVSMVQDTQNLDELVVVGYGVQKKSSLTGAVSQMKEGDFQNRSASSVVETLSGKVSGVEINSPSGAPGSVSDIHIRGFASTYSSHPLIIIDGRQGDISNLDPNDIESVEVLKDAASASIYGSQAGNGVILVTTKKGSGKGRISYSYQLVAESLAHKPKLMNSQQYVDYWVGSGVLSQETVDGIWDGKRSTDWIDASFETGLMQRHNLTFSAGNGKGNIYASMTYLTNDGIAKGKYDTFSRITGMLNASYDIKSWLQFNSNTQVEYHKLRNINEGGLVGYFGMSMQREPISPVYWTEDELPASMKLAQEHGLTLLQAPDGRYYSVSQIIGYDANPLLQNAKGYAQNRNYSLNNTTALVFRPMKGLTYTSRLGIVYGGGTNYNYSNDYYAINNYQFYMGVGATSSNNLYFQWENFANYNQSFGKHNVSAMIGMSFSKNRRFNVDGSIQGQQGGTLGVQMDDPRYYYLNYQTADATKTVGGGEDLITTKLAYFGRVGYNYADKYLLEFSFRADAADLSYLSKNKRWGYFPGVSAGWVLSEEKFMKDNFSWLPYLKIRGSWGQNGSLSDLGSFSYRSVIFNSGRYPFGNLLSDMVTGQAPKATGNDDLKWETSEQLDLGFDVRLFDGRFSLSADYYNKKTKDLILSNVVPSLIVGNTASPMNAGNIVNKGFELELGWNDDIKDFSYGIKGTLGYNHNEVTYIHPSLDSGIEGINWSTISSVTRFKVGHPAWYLYGYKFTGMDPETGNPQFEDINGDGQISDADRTDIGKGMPDITYGITLNAKWKNLDMIVFGQGSAGSDIIVASGRSDRVTNLLVANTENAWMPNNHNGDKPNPSNSNYSKYMISSGNVWSGDYFKIRQIQLGYTLPKTVVGKIGLNNLRMYVSLENFFTFTSYPGMDPESVGTTWPTSRGVDFGSYPSSKKVMFGLNVTI